jgi:hypothetical protein
LIEVLVSLLVFVIAVLGLTSAGIIAAEQDRMGWTDSRLWTAVHHQLDSLSTVGYENVTAGADTVLGFTMVWDIQGTDPKKIILETLAPNSKGVMVPDTFVTYLADW